MKELVAFQDALFNHISNEARASRAKVETTFAAWQAEKQLIDNDKFASDEFYRTKFEAPRNEREAAYNEYITTKQQLWEEFRAAPRSRKLAILTNIMRVPLPEILAEGVYTDHIYTKNVQIL